MRHSISSSIVKNRICYISGAIVLIALFLLSLTVGKYPLSLQELIDGNAMQWKVFTTLRLSRAIVGVIGGFALGVAGFVYQTIFRNPLASPDIIGVSSGASAGAAVGILLGAGSQIVTASSFVGAILAVALAILFSSIDKGGHKSTVVLAGIAVHSLAQTVLMCLKLTADPEKELASIEYWIMGSLNGINSHIIGGNLVICVICILVLSLLHRQMLLLSMDENEASMLGTNVLKLRLLLLVLSTVVVACIVSLTGLISFIGLLAPHCARKITGDNKLGTLVLCGLVGGCLLTGADILARSVAATELPVSIFTSLLGAPFLVLLIFKGRKNL